MHFISYLLLHNRSSLNDSCHVLSLMVSVDKELESSVAVVLARMPVKLQSDNSWAAIICSLWLEGLIFNVARSSVLFVSRKTWFLSSLASLGLLKYLHAMATGFPQRKQSRRPKRKL